MELKPLNRDEWRQAVLGVFEKIKEHKEPYEVILGGITLTVFPNVFSPKYFTDSLWFAEQLPEIIGQSSLLEIGTGTGIIGLFCALHGAHVTVTDINTDAVKNAKFNFERHKINIPVYLGSVYQPLTEDQKFDFIFWNHPFNNWETPVEETLLLAGLDHNYEATTAYISGASRHLTKHGRLLLGTGNNADIKTLQALASANGYLLKLLKEGILPLEEGGVINSYLIYEFLPKVRASV